MITDAQVEWTFAHHPDLIDLDDEMDRFYGYEWGIYL